MNLGKLVFAQVTQHLPLTTFRRCVARYGGAHKVKSFSCLDQYLCMAFAQLTYRDSLRDIEACLRAQAGKLYHMGIKSRVSRSTLADANESRDWRIYADFAQSLIAIARRLYAARARLASTSKTRSTLWMPAPSTCACRYLLGLRFARPRRPSSCTRCWTCAATSLRFSTSAMANCTTSTFWTCCCPSRALSHHGPRIHRLRTALSVARGEKLLCHPRQIQPQSPASLFASGRSKHGLDLRSDHRAHRLLLASRLRHAAASHPNQRPRQPASGWCSSPTISPCRHSPSPSFIVAGGRSSCFSNGSSSIFVSKSSSAPPRTPSKPKSGLHVSVYVLVAIVKKRLNLSASLYEMLQILSLTMFETNSIRSTA